MAAAFMRHLAADRVDVYSGGSEPAESVNPVAADAMAELGIDIRDQTPRLWSGDQIRDADVVVTMGCGDTCPYFPGTRYLDWVLPDPAGLPMEQVRPIRDEIERRVKDLLTDLGVG
jgi:protein-tyrosine-phosphatase